MEDTEPVTVRLALGYVPGEPLADDDEAPMWLTFTSGPICLLREEVVFTDAAEGAGYWRAQGVERIFVSLESAWLEGHFLWAGIGAPPLDPTTGKEMEVFSDDDPRGRREGALRTQLADMERENESRRAWHADMPRRDGESLRSRREALGLSIETVAERVKVDPAWLRGVEAGSAPEVRRSQWVELVWATQDGWPDPRRSRLTGVDTMWGWMPGPGGFSTAEALVKRAMRDD